LASFVPEQLEHLVFSFQPSLRLRSFFFIRLQRLVANRRIMQPSRDQSVGSESRHDPRSRPKLWEVTRLTPPFQLYLCALAGGATLGEAIERPALDEASLQSFLGFVFSEGLVTA